MTTRPVIAPHPRIAIVGAGVIGTILGAKLAKAGHDITVVERSDQRAQDIRTHGLRIETQAGSDSESFRVDVLPTLEAEADFDVAIVTARKLHLPAILAMLAPTKVATVLLMVSNAEGPAAIVDALGDRAVLGFPGAGGRVVDGVVQWSIPPAAMQPTMLGEVDGRITDRLRALKRILDSGGFHAKLSKNMDAWLKSHEGFVAAAGNATYIAGSGRGVAADRRLLTLNICAIREVYSAMDAARIPVSPRWFRTWQKLPLPVIRWTYGAFIGSRAWDDLGTDQLLSMRDEVEVVTEELIAFARAQQVSTPALMELARRRPALDPGPPR